MSPGQIISHLRPGIEPKGSRELALCGAGIRWAGTVRLFEEMLQKAQQSEGAGHG